MQIIVRNSGDQPIYDQIFQQIKAQVLSGELAPGTALPSIRALAKDLKISVITTKRAYDELEAAGFAETIPGKGCFVAGKDLSLLREQRLLEIEKHISAAVELSRSCGVGEEELAALLHTFFEEAFV